MRLHAPELPEAVAAQARRGRSRRCASSTSRSRPRSPSRSTGRARCCCSAPTTSTRTIVPRDDVDHRQAPHRPRRGGRAGRRAARAGAAAGVSLPARIVDFAEALRAEGVAVGTSELLDAFAALDEVPWTERPAFREALAATLAKSPDDRRVFELVFERFFFRAAEQQAVEREVREAGDPRHHRRRADRPRRPARAGDRRRSATATRARCATSRGSRSPRSAAAARAPACSASTSSGSAARSTCAATSQPREDGARAAHARPDPPLRAAAAARARARADRAHADSCRRRGRSTSSTARCRRGPLQDLAAVHRVVAQLKRRLATQGHETRGRRSARARRRAPHDARLAADRRRPGRAEVPARGGRGGPSSTCSATSRPASPARRCSSSSVLHALHDSFRKMRSFVFVERISEVTDVFERERDFKAVARRSGATPASPTSPATPTTGACGREFLALVEDDLHPRATVIVLGDARTNGRDPRADVFAQRRRARRAHVLAQPRAAPVLELRRLGGARVRAVLRAVRVLDDAPARGLREGAHAPRACVGTCPHAPDALERRAARSARLRALCGPRARPGVLEGPVGGGRGGRRSP